MKAPGRIRTPEKSVIQQQGPMNGRFRGPCLAIKKMRNAIFSSRERVCMVFDCPCHGTTDSTLAPTPNQRFSLPNLSWLVDREEGAMENSSSHIFLFAKKGLSNDYVGTERGTPYFRRYGRELALKPAISWKKSWGGGLP